MFNDRFLLTQAVLGGTKTMTRRTLKKDIPAGDWQEAERMLPYKAGEVVAIAQRYADIPWNCFPNAPFSLDAYSEHAGYRNKMFVSADLMPHHIRITGVRIERLQDISDEDILCEGVYKSSVGKNIMFHVPKKNKNGTDLMTFLSAREAYAYLIDKISGKGTWERNPAVAVYEFEWAD